MYGTTPSTGLPVRSVRKLSPGLSSAMSPRNLFTTNAATLARSSGSSSSIVPTKEAKTPPRSMSPTRSTGASASFATCMFTMSRDFKLISAGLPAPSITTRS